MANPADPRCPRCPGPSVPHHCGLVRPPLFTQGVGRVAGSLLGVQRHRATPVSGPSQRVRVFQFKKSDIDPEFKLRACVLGEGGSNLRSIRHETGASVCLTNPQDHDGETLDVLMELAVSGGPKTNLSRAAVLVQELMGHVKATHDSWRKKRTVEETIAIDCQLQPKFDLRSAVEGQKKINFQWIEEKTGAWLRFEGTCVRIKCARTNVERARRMVESLLRQVRLDHDGIVSNKHDAAFSETGDDGGVPGDVTPSTRVSNKHDCTLLKNDDVGGVPGDVTPSTRKEDDDDDVPDVWDDDVSDTPSAETLPGDVSDTPSAETLPGPEIGPPLLPQSPLSGTRPGAQFSQEGTSRLQTLVFQARERVHPDFNLRVFVEGADKVNFDLITQKTGAKLEFEGSRSSSVLPRLRIECERDDVEQVRRMVRSLLAQVSSDYKRFAPGTTNGANGDRQLRFG